ncbi:MAG: metalloregulator ArsR/SmtB family transcription factor [Bacteroidota bacterium]
MGVTRTENFTAAQNGVAKMMKALAHPGRIGIIAHIIKSNECICNNLVKVLGLAQDTISQHLRELKDAGLIKVLYQKRVFAIVLMNSSGIPTAKNSTFFVNVEVKDPCC